MATNYATKTAEVSSYSLFLFLFLFFWSMYLRYVLSLRYLKKERKLEHPEANHPKLCLQMGKR
jgi:heme O synthase-like polyprenyltransferase